MGRSKSKRESIASTTSPKSPSTSPGVRKGAPGNENSDTPARTANKRPMPVSTDSEEDDTGHSISEMMENGFPKSKKGRFVPQEEPNLGSADEDEESIDDNEESSEDEGDDSDVTIDDDDEDEEAEDDDDESDNVDPPAKALESTSRLPTKSDSSNSIPTKKSETIQTKPTAFKASDNIDPDAIAPSASEYFLVPNAPKDLSKLEKLLKDRGYSVSNVQLLRMPLALITLSMSSDTNALISANKPFSVDGTAVHFVRLEGSKNVMSELIGSSPTNSVFVAQIPKSVTMELLKSKLPPNCNPDRCKMLQTNTKKPFNAAIFHFSSKSIAINALKALSQVKFGDRVLRVSYGREMSATQATEDLRGSTRCLVAYQLPPNVTEAQMRNLFTTAVNFRMIAKHGETTCFMDFQDETAAKDAFDTHNNGSIGMSKLILQFARPLRQVADTVTAEVHNAPPSAAVPDLLALFPGASGASRQQDGHFVVQFPSADVRRTAVSGQKTLGDKPLAVYVYGGHEKKIGFFKNLPYKATEKDVRSVFPEASKIEIHFRSNGQSSGTATIEFPTSSICSAAVQKQCTLDGRRIFGNLKRIDVNAEEKRGLIQKTKQKNEASEQQKKRAVPPPVGSSSEGSGEEDQSEEEDEEMDEEDNVLVHPSKGASKVVKNVGSDSDESDGEDTEEEQDEEDDDEDDDDEEEDEDESKDSMEESEEGGSASDEEMALVPNKNQSQSKPFKNLKGPGVTQKGGANRYFKGQETQPDKNVFKMGKGGFQKHAGDGFGKHSWDSGPNKSGGGGGFKRGGGDGGFKRGGGDGGGFKRGGGDGGGFKRGGGDGGGFKRGGGFQRGGGDGGGFKRGGGGFKSRGGFQNRGGFNRGGFRGGKRGKNS